MGTSTERREDAGLKAALSTGKPKAAFFPTSADQPIISSKPYATALDDRGLLGGRSFADSQSPGSIQTAPRNQRNARAKRRRPNRMVVRQAETNACAG
jgi:hypothetical protein